MLTSEQSRDLLKTHLVKNAEKQQVDYIHSLPKSLHEIAFNILGRDAEGKTISYYSSSRYNYVQEQQRRQSLWIQFDDLTSEDRLSIFAGLFPKISPHIEHTWQFMKQMPYQAGYQRKAFRAPNNPHITLGTRSNWLQRALNQLGNYHETIEWFTTYAAYLGGGYASYSLSPLFAATIDSDEPESDLVFDLLLASGRGDHEVATMGRHVPRSLLLAPRQAGWEFVEKLLLAAQRQEGLRQTIVEVIDECHPEAFYRILRLILDHDLIRFSSVVRAFDVWLGYQWDAASAKVINQTLERLYTLLKDENARQDALKDGVAEDVYLSLWVEGYHDVEKALPKGIQLLDDADVERRFAGVHFLSQTLIPKAANALIPKLEDGDLRIVARALDSIHQFDLGDTDLFERVETLLARLPEKTKTLDSIIWTWNSRQLETDRVAQLLLQNLGERDPKRLIPYLDRLDIYSRIRVAKKLAKQEQWDTETRDTLLNLLKDRSPRVRNDVISLLDEHGEALPDDDIPKLEALLTRKSADLRRGVIRLLMKQTTDGAVLSGERLCQSKKKPQRHAGLELLALLADDHLEPTKTQAIAFEYIERYPELDKTAEALINRIKREQEKIPTLDDALGLMNPDNRTPVPTLTRPDIMITSKAATASLLSLDKLLDQNRERPVTFQFYGGEREVLLGNIHENHIPYPKLTLDPEEDVKRLPLADVLREWYENRPDELRDEDCLELLRMWVMLYCYQKDDVLGFLEQITGEEQTHLQLTYRSLLKRLIIWLLRLYPVDVGADYLLDSIEYRLSTYEPKYINAEQAQRMWGVQEGDIIDWRDNNWRRNEFANHVFLARTYYNHIGYGWNEDQIARWWGLLRWIDEGIDELPRFRPTLYETVQAHRIDAAKDDDLYDLLLGARENPTKGYSYYTHFNDLRTLSVRNFSKNMQWVESYQPVHEIYQACRERILEVEVKRGDLPTAASKPAMALRTIPGSKRFAQILQALGKSTLLRGYIYGDGGARNSVFSKLLKSSYPTQEDTPETFAEAIKGANIKEKRLIEATVYAPQWAHLAETVIEWEGYTDAVWWIHAHTKDTRWSVDQDVRQLWAAQVDERTPLKSSDLQAGAVDVMWFKRVYEKLGDERWQTVYDAAKYASSSGGHTRARLFADAMLGQIEQEDIIKRIQDKRHQDSVRALGLLPIGDKNRGDVILERYQLMQEFLRGSRKFGSQRQESEKTAVRIAMENLARTAGFPDPQRLQWAMEAREVADLRDGPLVLEIDNVTLTLSIDGLGDSHLTVEKTDKKGNIRKLKNIPAKLKKLENVKELRERKKQVERQSSRMRRSLEESMCRMDSFTVNELAELFKHPVLKPMLESLIFVGEIGIGYLIDDGVALESHDMTQIELPSEAKLRIAHPYDLYQTGEWHLWQKDCFVTERIQPFKQVFRELYVVTDNERQEPHISERYSGHQVQPRQALALLGSRSWVVRPEEGVQRTFHQEEIAAFLSFMDGFYTPAQVEDLTISGVVFAKPGEWWEPIPLIDVPPILFSEVMRDLDLVVSVAHSGGVDPEASASTIEMRTALLQETLALLKVDNVRIEKNHAFVDGKLGTYSIHLGSAIVHRQPGGSLCIIPVHSQHRGRLFLPFADDDPKNGGSAFQSHSAGTR